MTRVCVICQKRTRRAPDGSTESTIGFQTALASLGLTGDKAHPSCIREARPAKPDNRREWEDALVRDAVKFTCSVPIEGPRPRGQRLQWDVFGWLTLRAAILDAENHGPRALVYAVSPAGDSAPLARADWPRYLQLRGEA